MQFRRLQQNDFCIFGYSKVLVNTATHVIDTYMSATRFFECCTIVCISIKKCPTFICANNEKCCIHILSTWKGLHSCWEPDSSNNRLKCNAGDQYNKLYAALLLYRPIILQCYMVLSTGSFELNFCEHM